MLETVSRFAQAYPRAERTVHSQYDLIETRQDGANVIHGEFMARLSYRSNTWFIDSAMFKRFQPQTLQSPSGLPQAGAAFL